jgi:hypothetical protein
VLVCLLDFKSSWGSYWSSVGSIPTRLRHFFSPIDGLPGGDLGRPRVGCREKGPMKKDRIRLTSLAAAAG